MFSDSVHFEGSFGSADTPEKEGPRQCGQFSALKLNPSNTTRPTTSARVFRMDDIFPNRRFARKDANAIPSPRVRSVLWGGVLAGTLDILAAFALSASRGGRPIRVLQGIASGLLGPAAMQGGTSTAALGLLLHFAIALTAAAVYFVASRRMPVLVRHASACGLAYGVIVYLFMNHVVLPLSRVTRGNPPLSVVAWLVVIHMFCVGLPIALTVRAASRR